MYLTEFCLHSNLDSVLVQILANKELVIVYVDVGKEKKKWGGGGGQGYFRLAVGGRGFYKEV